MAALSSIIIGSVLAAGAAAGTEAITSDVHDAQYAAGHEANIQAEKQEALVKEQKDAERESEYKDQASKERDATLRRQRLLGMKAQGREGTILGGALGAPGDGAPKLKTILGG
jgi:hypothetical protein